MSDSWTGRKKKRKQHYSPNKMIITAQDIAIHNREIEYYEKVFLEIKKSAYKEIRETIGNHAHEWEIHDILCYLEALITK